MKRLVLILSIILGVILFKFWIIRADNLEELNQAILTAQKKYNEASLALENVNKELYHDFINFPWSEKFQRAEKILIEQFSKEYYEYITAKTSLDDLLYLSFTAKFNHF